MKNFLGIELGSTRIKAVLIDENHAPAASGAFDWENRLDNGFWTYSLGDVWRGIQAAYAEIGPADIDGIGISAMMHGYMAFDKNGGLLTPFRTWRNTSAAQAADELTDAFGFNIPSRWSIAHLYQAILNKETHVPEIVFMTTLAGYVHRKLTGEKVLGLGDASGMFPVRGNAYDKAMSRKFHDMTGIQIEDIFPRILPAGENAGTLTADGAKLLDPTGGLKAGIPLCPPEGDAGTGMVATNTVSPRTGNLSAGTSVFAMIVLEKPIEKVSPEIDIVATPDGKPVAMVHCNSCTSDLNGWIDLFGEAAKLMGADFDKNTLYEKMYASAVNGESECGGLMNYNFFSGEPVAGIDAGCPLFFRKPESELNISNFMRTQLYSAVAALKLGMDILSERENVKVDKLLGHGGLFKTKNVGQKLVAGALNVPVTVMETAGEGGAWGIALLAAYAAQGGAESLGDYLLKRVFAGNRGVTVNPDPDDVKGFASFINRYKKGLDAARVAANILYKEKQS